jgi:hypothetical protein
MQLAIFSSQVEPFMARMVLGVATESPYFPPEQDGSIATFTGFVVATFTGLCRSHVYGPLS